MANEKDCAFCVAFDGAFGLGDIRPATTTRRAAFVVTAGMSGDELFCSDGETDIPLCDMDAEEVDGIATGAAYYAEAV